MTQGQKQNRILWNWRKFFAQKTVAQGESDEREGKIVQFQADPDGHWARGRTANGFSVSVMNVPTDYEQYMAAPEWDRLKIGRYVSGNNAFYNYYTCNCSMGEQGIRCRHLVSLLYHWERVHGPFFVIEDEEQRKARLAREAAERERAEKESRTEDAGAFLRSHTKADPEDVYFSLGKAQDELTLVSNQYEREMAEEILAGEPEPPLLLDLNYDRSGELKLKIAGKVQDATVQMLMTRDSVQELSCTCGRGSFGSNNNLFHSRYQREMQRKLCCHQLVFWVWAKGQIQRENPGDETDYKANRLLSFMTAQKKNRKEPETQDKPERQKRPEVSLAPRIVRESGYRDDLKLTFDISVAGGRDYAVRSLDDLVKAVEDETEYQLGKNLCLNFAEQTFQKDSEIWYDRAAARVQVARKMTETFRNRGGYGYYATTFTAGNHIDLSEAELDSLYSAAEGGQILYQWGSRRDAQMIPVGPAHPKAEVVLAPYLVNQKLKGIQISGVMPRFEKGLMHSYTLNRDGFGRVDESEMQDLEAFRTIADYEGAFQCVIGARKYAEFFYRVLPRLRESDQVILKDNITQYLEGLLPPEAAFTFYIDLEEFITCEIRVAYEERGYTLAPEIMLGADILRDRDQENRVMEAVQGFFPDFDGESGTFRAKNEEEVLIRILTEGVEALSAFGEVKGSEAFRRIQFRPAPQPKVSIELENGLLELSIQTKDLSEAELLELLGSYRRRKRWHRLRNGDFVDLRNAQGLAELEETALAMDMTVEELLKGDVHLPKYRALYVDKLLEAHDELAASRDRHFKALIRSFQTIRDSDFEVSEALTETLRPYQMYGFRWLSTLAQAGFGGILADEMGLGKTIQMLAFLQMQKVQGETRPALVVCPASLVYNWKEESRKFTPGLSVDTLAGNLPARKKQIQAIREGNGLDLYVTSYDLLKRDIALYDGIVLSTVILDEAQFVKNQKAQVSKAVRVLKAEHRFALTGTPIENRLSELWSIFDFLMPGFLYSASDFSDRFELPIMKRKDPEATEKLSKMTGPFILRRKKTDVLKDLPEKLEEVRSTAMDEDQRRLYDAQVVRMRELLASSGNSGEDKMRILAEITRLRQLCCDPSLLLEDYRGSSAKRAACLELIQTAMDGGHRMLVFSQFTSMLALLAEDLRKEKIPFFTITGATSKQERLRLVNEFNGGDTPVFLISLKAGGTGLNLTGADVVIHYDPWWNLAVQNQATDRAHRIGQTRQVTVMKLIAADTIEEKIVELQEAKRDLAEAIISGENSSLMSLSKEELLALIE